MINGSDHSVVFDLGDLEFLDASGLRLLMHAHGLAVREAGWLWWAQVHPMVHRVLRITRLTQVLPVFYSLEQAVGEPSEVDRGECDAPA